MGLNIGDLAPDFEFINQNGEKTNLHGIEGKKIIFFFPKAFTPGCTKQSCSIRDSYDDLKNKGISEIIGISTDKADKQHSFAEKYNLKFVLVDDSSKEISKAYGSLKNYIITSFSKRITFLINEDNKIESIKDIGLRGGNSEYGLKKYGQELLEFDF